MSRIRFALIVVLAMGALTACTPATEAGVPVSTSGAGVPTLAPSGTPPPAPTPRASVPVAPATPTPAVDVSAPERLRIIDLDVDMPVLPVGVQRDGSMEIPERPSIAGWYRFGPTPADAEGATVIAAHVDDREFGIGPLAKLRTAEKGSAVSVTDEAGAVVEYEVESVTYIPRAQLPVEELFTREGPRTLVLITCGGSFDEQTRSYSDNVVLIARAS